MVLKHYDEKYRLDWGYKELIAGEGRKGWKERRNSEGRKKRVRGRGKRREGKESKLVMDR